MDATEKKIKINEKQGKLWKHLFNPLKLRRICNSCNDIRLENYFPNPPPLKMHVCIILEINIVSFFFKVCSKNDTVCKKG